jgi:hypothetical protein
MWSHAGCRSELVRQKGTSLHSVPLKTATGASAARRLPVKSARKAPVSRLSTSKGPRVTRGRACPAGWRSRNRPAGDHVRRRGDLTMVLGCVPTMVMNARISSPPLVSGFIVRDHCWG